MKENIFLKAVIEKPLLNNEPEVLHLFVQIINEITSCMSEDELKGCMNSLTVQYPYFKLFFDYGFENNHVSFKNTRTSIASHKTVCLSFGLAAWVGLLIPFLNLVMIPAAVCGGTLLWHERLKPDFADYINIRRNNNSASKQAPSSSSKSLTSK